jgi:hypothetical protein
MPPGDKVEFGILSPELAELETNFPVARNYEFFNRIGHIRTMSQEPKKDKSHF